VAAITISPPARRSPKESDRERSDRRLFARYAAAHNSTDRDAVVERFLPLARHLAARYQRPDVPFDDVFQVACYGLVNAVERFDVERGVSFSSYAVPTMIGEIKRYFRDRAWAVRVPRDVQELALRVERVIGEFNRRRGRQPSVEELADELGIEPEHVLEAMEGDDRVPRNVPRPATWRGRRRARRGPR
jgi:RNA polymerase sigma-B factor